VFPHVTIEAAGSKRTSGVPRKLSVRGHLITFFIFLLFFLYGEITPEECPSILDTPCVLEMKRTWNEPLMRKPFVFIEDCAEVFAVLGFCATHCLLFISRWCEHSMKNLYAANMQSVSQ
jgi:hypothetical protein